MKYDVLADLTSGFSGAEIVQICQEAAYHALEVDADSVNNEHIVMIIGKTERRISGKEVEYFESFLEKLA